MSKTKKTKKGKERIIFATGKRKKAVARAMFKKGKGKITINKKPVSILKPEMIRLMIQEPILLSEGAFDNVDVKINTKGGGQVGQAEAVRQALATGILKFTKNKELEEKFKQYDPGLLVPDSRQTEPHKPSRSSQGPRRHKQRSKR